MISFLTSLSRQAAAWLIGVLLLSFGPLHAQTNTAAPTGNRFLLVIETSKEMQKRAAGLGGTVDQLIRSGMQGQARPGDTLGVWTYNETLNAGQFPLQTWTKDAGKHISAAVLGHLGEQK